MGKAAYARKGGGFVAKSADARAEFADSKASDVLVDAGKAGSGVRPATAGMGKFARSGNEEMRSKAVAVQTGLASIGPTSVGPIARVGGQVRLAPGQIKAWAHPKDPTPKPTTQYRGTGSNPPAAGESEGSKT